MLQIEKVIKYSFKNKELLKIALTHSSFSSYPKNYERFELLGDSILDLVVIERLLLFFPTKDEGYLTKQKNYLVSSKNLSFISNKLNLINYIIFNKSLIIKDDSVKKRISCDIYEAIIGAIYLDSDYKYAQTFIKDTLFKYYDINEANSSNYKGILNEFCQKKGLTEPTYKIIEINGPEHQKVYKVELFINNSLFVGNGSKLKEAEESAANKALLTLK